MKTELTRRLELSQKMEQYDEHCKNILADKRILAWIMKETMKEFQSLEIDDIMQYIEGSPDVSSIPVDPGMTNSPVIHGIGTEGNIPYEGAVYFDIRFMAGLPKKETGIIVNLEAQKEMRRGYSIVTRGIFYGARMISAQMGTEFTAPDYQKIKKVFSVWICFHSPQYIGNAVSSYGLQKNDIVPGIPDIPEEYDKVEIIQICLNPERENRIKLTELLNLIFNSKLPYKEKVTLLRDSFGFPVEAEFGEELKNMCNVSQYIFGYALEEGIEQGLQQGIEQGLQQGIEQGLQQGLQQGIEQGMEQGLQQGMEQGRQSRTEEIVRRMREENYPEDQIIRICGVTKEELLSIK